MRNLTQITDESILGSKVQNFQKLMKFKIREILLVSSLYDSYLFEEDGRLYELIRREYQGLNLNYAPEITHVSNGREAIELALDEDRFDLIICTLHIEDMHSVKFARMVREAGLNMPIVLLAFDNKERKDIVSSHDTSIFEKIFIWQGDYRLLIGIIKNIEDRLNIENDTKTVGVQCIILVEDNVKFYSKYLPLIYTEILNSSQRLISEGINLTHKFLRMRARPKIILCTTYEEAWECFEKYEEYILGVISDINFKHGGVKDPEAGIKFAKAVKARHEDISVLLQSSNPEFAEAAAEIGATFVHKNSPRLLHELRQFMIQYFFFGDFIFRTPEGRQVGRASNLKTLEEQLHVVPDESILYHAKRNHFSNWLKARTEFWLAHSLRPRKVSEFESVDALRKELIKSLREYQELRQRGTITDFTKETFDPRNSFARIGGGSLGGKARGLGFINTLINNYALRYKFEEIELSVPAAVVLGTDVFDQFLGENLLENFALNETDDQKITKRFTESIRFPMDVIRRLEEFLEIVNEPIAVRSSSLLEDSQYQPFAGVYQTYMLPNNDPDPDVRLLELLNTIKCVYASTFFQSAKDYMRATTYRLEEEKMAVIIQRMAGSPRNGRFYPDFAGVAKSYNFYPIPPQKSTDGIAHVAFGLGKTVVDGGNVVRFCPKYPRHLLQFYSTSETIRNAQQDFYALNLGGHFEDIDDLTHDCLVQKYDLSKAEQDNTLYSVGSTYSAENNAVYDGISRQGRRVVTFAPVLKHKLFPLPEILDLILELGSWGMGTQIEIEFAVNLHPVNGKIKEFSLLQMRPMVLSSENEVLQIDNIPPDKILVESPLALGNGEINNISDVIVVDIDSFDRGKSREVAIEVGMLNTKMVKENKQYILIGVGRWGSLDNWLGIPVTWDQISGAAAIVESGFKDFNVTPSQGSHFFQNITSFRIGYFTINPHIHQGHIDWEWLRTQPTIEELKYTKHLSFGKPLVIKINGHQNKGVILKPDIHT